jgi:aldehyde dehydrogenase (NAD+)
MIPRDNAAMRTDVAELLERMALPMPPATCNEGLTARSPIDGDTLGPLPAATPEDCKRAIACSRESQLRWRDVPAPQRGELVRQFALELRTHHEDLGALVTLETGKIVAEGRSEVQEMIDICDFAVGLSRQLHGLTIASERPEHRMQETWHPFGICAIITAFNFPVAVWAWNAALALVCGNAVVWKPSEKAPLCAWAAHQLLRRTLARFDPAFLELAQVLQGDRRVGALLVEHPDVRLVSATGSTAMGRAVGEACARTFKRSLLELGGNNAAIVCASADVDLAVRAIVFAAVGTAGQRCTSLRRLFVQRELHDRLLARLQDVYATIRIGDPRDPQTLVGPLIDGAAHAQLRAAIAECAASGAAVSGGERVLAERHPGAYYVRPALVPMRAQAGGMLRETFAPLLYVMPFDDLDEAIALNNAARHGLSSCIFTRDLREAEVFLSARGSDCGIANVNIGTSGAEIGGAFGGEKETGGGRESGSDAWKNYMRRATNTINYGRDLPLAQGLRFDV